MTFLEGLPRTRSGGRSHRLGQALLLGWLVGVALGVASGVAGYPFVMGIIIPVLFVTHFVVVITLALMQTRAAAAIDRAESLAETDSARAVEEARHALVVGTKSGAQALRAWLVLARCAEEAGALADADEALRRGVDARPQADRGMLVHAHLLWAFVKAARGDVEGAERSAGIFGTVDVGNAILFAEYLRAKAMILYRRGAYREVIDVADEAAARAAIRNGRDAALYASLRQSSMLRLEAALGGGPLRVAHDPREEAWLESAVPDLARHAR